MASSSVRLAALANHIHPAPVSESASDVGRGRLVGKVAVVVGAGQTKGETIGNGRATALLFAREQATVLLVDRDADSLKETAEQIAVEGGKCETLVADVAQEAGCRSITETCLRLWGHIDVLHYNVGIGGGDAGTLHLNAETWGTIIDVNTRGFWLSCKHCLPAMRKQGGGTIVAISSVASIAAPTGGLSYKVSKAAMNATVQHIAMENAKYGIRANAVLPGLMDTPMAIEGFSKTDQKKRGGTLEEARRRTRKARNERVPLKGEQGSAWDVAHAVLFLASDEARFITGVTLPVDGGLSARVG